MAAGDDTIAFRVRVTPKADRDSIEGPCRDAQGDVVLAVRVRAAPDKGAANEAVLSLLAKALHLRRAEVSLTRGASARIKTFKAPARCADALRTLMSPDPSASELP